jgi:RNA polymerase sigma factor (sigma-70 family)
MTDYSKLASCVFISGEQERRFLSQRDESGGITDSAFKSLVISHIPFVVKIAKRYGAVTSIPYEDLVGEGIIGLQIAINRFDLTRPGRLISYATPWINKHILLGVDKHIRPVRFPTSLTRDMSRAANGLNLSPKRQSTVENAPKVAVVLDADGWSALADPFAACPGDEAALHMDSAVLNDAIRELTPEEQYALNHFYPGLGLSTDMRLSKATLRRLHQRALLALSYRLAKTPVST